MPKSFCYRFGIATIALGVVFSQAHALDIVINANAALAGNAAALAAFNRAAVQWEAVFTDPITVTINGGLANLGGGGVIGSTSSVFLGGGFNSIRNQMVADAADEASNSIVGFLPTAAEFSAFLPSGRSLSGNMAATKANLKAMGFTGLDATWGVTDATITFNSNFAFHYGAGNPPGGLMDFETVASHEIGHALGFVSTVDNVAGGANPVDVFALDLFRFPTSGLPGTTGAFTTNPRSLAPGQAASFSDTASSFAFSTSVIGDGRQASHWKDDDLTGVNIGIMDPTLDFGDRMLMTEADLRAFDLIGWDRNVPVPEPASIAALSLGGLALLRRRRVKK